MDRLRDRCHAFQGGSLDHFRSHGLFLLKPPMSNDFWRSSHVEASRPWLPAYPSGGLPATLPGIVPSGYQFGSISRGPTSFADLESMTTMLNCTRSPHTCPPQIVDSGQVVPASRSTSSNLFPIPDTLSECGSLISAFPLMPQNISETDLPSVPDSKSFEKLAARGVLSPSAGSKPARGDSVLLSSGHTGAPQNPVVVSKPRWFSCSVAGCRRRFKKPEHLSRHMLKHSTEKEFECWVPDCSRQFNRRDNYQSHMKTHAKKRGRNRYVATLDENSPEFDPEFRGELDADGSPVR